MLRPALVSALLLSVPYLSAGHACNLSNSDGLSDCVKDILELSRPALKAKFDPLLLDNMNGSGTVDWWIRDVRVHGLGKYRIEHLSIIVLGRRRIRVQFAVTWPSLIVTAAGKVRFCKKGLDSDRCPSITGHPRIIVVRPSARLETHLHLAVRNGRLQLTPSGTRININLPRISVEVNLHGLLGLFDKSLGYPSKKYATELSTRWWNKNKKKIESKAKSQLHRLIHKHLSPGLAVLLRGAGR